MKTFIALLFTICLSFVSYSQTYVMTFEGSIDPFSITQLEQKCSQIDRISSTKIKYKAESNKGELFFTLSPLAKELVGEERDDFSPIPVKTFLLENNLYPLSFRILKD